MPRWLPFAWSRRPSNTEGPLTAVENHAGQLHCDACEMGETLHDAWRSVGGARLRVLCQRCLDKGER